MNSNIRSNLYFCALMAAIAAGVFGGLAIVHAAVAHAEPAAAGDWHPAVQVIESGTGWVGILAAVLAAASIILHVVAPWTKTTKDDWARDEIDRLRALLVGAAPPPDPPPDPVPAKPQAGFVDSLLLGVLACVVVGSLLSIGAVGCAARQRGAAGAETYLDCEAPALHDAVADTASWAKDRIVSLILGTGKPDYARLREAMGYLKSDVGKCAYAAAIAALTYQPPAGVTEQALSGGPVVDKAALRAAFVAARSDLGWGEVRTNGVTL